MAPGQAQTPQCVRTQVQAPGPHPQRGSFTPLQVSLSLSMPLPFRFLGLVKRNALPIKKKTYSSQSLRGSDSTRGRPLAPGVLRRGLVPVLALPGQAGPQVKGCPERDTDLSNSPPGSPQQTPRSVPKPASCGHQARDTCPGMCASLPVPPS